MLLGRSASVPSADLTWTMLRAGSRGQHWEPVGKGALGAQLTLILLVVMGGLFLGSLVMASLRVKTLSKESQN